MKLRNLLTLVLGAGLAMTACKKGTSGASGADSTATAAAQPAAEQPAAPAPQTNEADNAAKANLAARWKVMKAKGPGVAAWDHALVTFKEDGTMSMTLTNGGAVLSGTWSLENQQVKLTLDGTETVLGYAVVSETKVTLSANDNNVQLVRL